MVEDQDQGIDFGDLRSHVPREIRDVSFPSVVRGYDRAAVDAYVQRVNQVIAELEVSRTPHSAVRHALDRVGEHTTGILQRAREAAEDITASAQAEADEAVGRARSEADKARASALAEAEETVARARSEAEEIVVRARTEATERLRRLEQEVSALQEEADERMRKLDADTESIWQERRKLVDDVRRLAGRLEEIAAQAAASFPERPSLPSEDEETTVAVTVDPSVGVGVPARQEDGGGEPSDEKAAQGQ